MQNILKFTGAASFKFNSFATTFVSEEKQYKISVNLNNFRYHLPKI